MKPSILIGLILIILLFLVTGCTLTQKNADIIAKQLQEKYDKINSYQATVTEDDGDVRLVQMKRPDKHKDIPINPVDRRGFICNGDVKIDYDFPEAKKFLNYDCTKDISNSIFFFVTNVIKELANYENKISWDKLNGEEAIKVVIIIDMTDSSDKVIGTQEITAWLSKENYLLLKIVMKVKPRSGFEGRIEHSDKPLVIFYSDLELNKDIPDSEFELVIPSDITRICEIDALKGKEDYIKCSEQWELESKGQEQAVSPIGEEAISPTEEAVRPTGGEPAPIQEVIS